MRVDFALRLAEEFAHRVAAQRVPLFDRGAAGAGPENVVEQVFQLDVLFYPLHQDAENFDENLFRRRFFQHAGVSRKENGVPAELFGEDSEPGEGFPVFQNAGELFGGQVDRLGNEEALGIEFADILVGRADLFVEDPLVQRVLVDERHAGFGLEDEETVVNLNDRFSVGRSGDLVGGNGVIFEVVGFRRVGREIGGPFGEDLRLAERRPRRGGVGIGAERRRRTSAGRGARGERRVRTQKDAGVGRRRLFPFGTRAGPVEEILADLFGQRGVERALRGISLGGLDQVGRRPAPHIGSEELVPDRRKERGVDAVRLEEPDFHLGRVNVDVDQRGVDFDLQEGDRIPPDHQKPPIRLHQRVLERLVADVSAV